MKTWQATAAVLAVGMGAVLGVCVVDAADPAKPPAPKPAAGGALVIVDAAGKEQKITSWQFTAGTRRLGWLAPAAAPDKEPAKAPARRPRKPTTPAGPEALEFLAEMEVTYLENVLTLIPLDRLRSLEYDNDKNTVTAHVATSDKPDDDIVLTGSTKYKRLNKLIIEAEVDKGDAGVAAIKYLGGVPRGIRAIRFPAPKPAAKAAAVRPAVVVSRDEKKMGTHPVADLLALYREDGGEKLLPTLMFKKTLKLDMSKIKKIVVPEGESDEPSWQVMQKDGDDSTLTLLQATTLGGKSARLEGLLGRVPAGYKLFPVPTIAEIRFDTSDAEEKKDK